MNTDQINNIHSLKQPGAPTVLRQTLTRGVESGEITQIALLIDDQLFYIPLDTSSLTYAATLLYTIHLTEATQPTPRKETTK